MTTPEIKHLLKLAEGEEVTGEQVLESYQWAGEFMEAVSAYLSTV